MELEEMTNDKYIGKARYFDDTLTEISEEEALKLPKQTRIIKKYDKTTKTVGIEEI
jgi:hypothetical protein